MTTDAAEVRAVAVLAGRRADPRGAERPVLPEAARERVRSAIGAILVQEAVDLLIASAASGADLLGLQAASELGVRTRVVLPFGVRRFRDESVTDRGGNWGDIYDRLVELADSHGDLLVCQQEREADPFLANNRVVIEEAIATGSRRRIAIVVWDGLTKGSDDATADLTRRAREGGFEIFEISPLDLA